MRLFIVDGESKVAIVAANDVLEAQTIFEKRFDHNVFSDIVVVELITPPDQGILTILRDDESATMQCSCSGGCGA